MLCDGGTRIHATTSVPETEIYESGNFTTNYRGNFDADFDPGETEDVGLDIGDTTQEENQGELVYSSPGGGEVTAEFSLDEHGVFGGGACDVVGTAIYSG